MGFAACDRLTVLHSVNGRYATKRIGKTKKGEIQNRSYGSEKHFRVESILVGDFAELSAELAQLAEQHFAFVIRGEPGPGINRKHARRLLHPDKKTNDPPTFTAAPRHWFAIDLDHIAAAALTDPANDPEAAVEYLIGLLPPDLHDVSCYWQFTSSQSLPGHEGTLSARLWYWSGAALDDAELTRWAAAVNRVGKLIDASLYRAVQPHYVAAPIFAGMADPLPRRWGIRQGLEDEVYLVLPPADAKNPEMASGLGYAPGRGAAAWLAEIGGGQGFREPLVKAIASYIAIYGSKADCSELKKAIGQAVDRADPGGRSADKIERYKSDEHLDEIIAWVREQHGDQPPKAFIGEPPDWIDEAPAETAAPAVGLPARPSIRVANGELPAVVDAAEEILISADRDLYEFADQIVRPALKPLHIADEKTAIGLRLVPVRLHHMIERFTRCIEFLKFSKRDNKWHPVDCPDPVAKTYLERIGQWRLPKLTALASCPLLLRNGRIVQRPGFDPQSGILFDPRGVAFPPVSATPSKPDGLRALKEIKALFSEFPFVSDQARSVLLSALLTSVSRLAYDFAPLHGFDAPVAGTGKSKLVECCSILVDGHECPVISQGSDGTEFEKRLGAELLEGNRMISIDNCEAALGGQLLCQAATQHLIKVRLLGFSRSVLVINNTLLFATGNNLRLHGDMLRRGLIGRLDAGEERPELRCFTREDPVHVLKRERGAYVNRALTVLRAYLAAGRPVQPVQPLGGFEGWSALVRNTLLWLGEADPVETIETARAEDPDRQRLEVVITQWQTVLGARAVTTRAVITEAEATTIDKSGPVSQLVLAHPDFRNALLDVAGDRDRISARRLGNWLARNKRKAVGADRLAVATLSAGNICWKLEQKDASGVWR
jgi:hypothetical protein